MSTWRDKVQREEDATRVQALLNNSTQHALLLAAVPEEGRDWVKYLFDAHWNWAAGHVVLVALLATGSKKATDPAAIKYVMATLWQLARMPNTREELSNAARQRSVSATVDVVLRLMRNKDVGEQFRGEAVGTWGAAAATAPRN